MRADENALREILFNLLSNSIDAAGPGGTVRIVCYQEDNQIVARFHDTGPGIAPEVQSQLFHPFFTTKHAGTGLGLYVTNRHIRECGGTIACDSGPGRGTCFIVTLPCFAQLGAASPTVSSRVFHDKASYSDCR